MKTTPIRIAALLLVLGLSACGGGDDATTPTPVAPAPAGGTLTLNASSPVGNDGALDLSTASASGNDARPADSFSAQPYCEIFWENVLSSNGTRYSVQVYFRQSDQAVLHTSVVDSTFAWSVYDSNSGTPITGITVDTTAKTLSYASKVLNGASTETTTVNGTVSFPANATTPACGS